MTVAEWFEGLNDQIASGDVATTIFTLESTLRLLSTVAPAIIQITVHKVINKKNRVRRRVFIV
jgi:hypothetical protein